MNAYEKSNKETSVKLNKFRNTEYIKLLNCSEDRRERENAAQTLLNYLCIKFKMPLVQLSVTDKKQAHKDNYNGTLREKRWVIICETIKPSPYTIKPQRWVKW